MCIFGNVVFSQKKTQVTSQQRGENAIQYAFSEMENSLKRGDYEKAYDIASRLFNSLNVFEKKQKANEIFKQSKKFINLRFEAYSALRNSNYKLALEKYDNILKENPTDIITKNDRVNLIAIIKQPKVNILEKVLEEAKVLFNEAINNTTNLNIQERERNILKARKIWSVVAQTSPNYQKDIVSKGISAADEILESINSIKIAIKNNNSKKAIQIKIALGEKFPELRPVLNVIIEDSKKNREKYFTWKKEAEKAFCDLNYSLVLKNIGRITKLEGYAKDSYTRQNGRKFDVQVIQKAKTEIASMNESNNVLILAYYEKIMSKNPCDKIEYFEYVSRKLESAAASSGRNCNLVVKYGLKLLTIDEKKAILNGVKARIDICNDDLLCEEKCKTIYLKEFQNAKRLRNSGNLAEAESLLKEFIIKNTESIKNCKCDSIINQTENLLTEIGNEKKSQGCISIAKLTLENVKANDQNNELENSLDLLNRIDTLCLFKYPEILVQIKIERKKIMHGIKENLFITLKDSALTQESQNFHKDLFSLLGKAKEIAPDSNRLMEINDLIKAKCCTYKLLESEEKGSLCIECLNNCCTSNPPPQIEKDSSQIKKSLILIGPNFSSGNVNFYKNPLNTINTFKGNLGFSLGLVRQRLNFTKVFDIRYGLKINYSNFSLFSSRILGVDVPLDFKWHRKKSYHSNERYYLVSGTQIGKNLALNKSLSTDYASFLNSYNIGLLVGAGVELNSVKEGFYLELGLVNKRNIFPKYSNLNLIDSESKLTSVNINFGFRFW